MRSAADELVWLLADQGVEHLFMNPGTDTAPIQEALAAARRDGTPHPRSVLCIHEHVALSAALGHHAVSGRPQAVLVHVDAGTLNLGGAVHQAQRNRTPVVVMAGRSPYSTDAEVPGHRDTPIMWPQEQPDQAVTFRAYGKWAMEVPRGRELARIVRRAFQVAETEPCGPVYVMLPREALMEPPAAERSPCLVPPRPAGPDPAGLAELAAALAEAERPVIVTGRTGQSAEAAASLGRIAGVLGCPVLDSRERLNLPARHPLNAGVEGQDFLREADCVLILDSDVPWVPALASPPAAARILQIDADCVKATMPTWGFRVDVPLAAATRVALPMLEAELERHGEGRSDAWTRRREVIASRVAELHLDWDRRAEGLQPADLPDAYMSELNRALTPDAVVLEEAVTNRAACIRQLDRPPGGFFDSGAPSLGWAVGAAVGASLALPGRPVVAVCGDGSFNFGVPTAALWSARRAGGAFMTVVLNNGGYYASKRPVQSLYPGGASVGSGEFPETDLSDGPDVVGIARSCGGEGAVVTHPNELGAAVAQGLATVRAGRCSVLDVRLPTP